MSTIDFDLVDVPVEFKKITPDDFNNEFYKSTIEFINPDSETGFIYDELMPILKKGIDIQNTVVINAGTGQGKSKCIIDIVSEYVTKDEYIVVFALPFNNLIEQYFNQCRKIIDESQIFNLLSINENDVLNKENELKSVFDVNDDDEFLRTPSPKEYKIHIVTVNALLANAGEDAIFQANKKHKHFEDLIKTCTIKKKKIVLIFDEIHDSIYNFQEDLIFKLWKFKNVIHKNYIISATFNESSKEIIKYLSEFTERKIQIIESNRLILDNKQGNLHLVLHQDDTQIIENPFLKGIFKNFILDNKTFDVVVYAKSQLEKLKKKDYFGLPHNLKLNFCYSDIFKPEIIRKYDPLKTNIGTNFSTGINIEKPNHNLVIILPPRTNIKFFKNKGIFTSGYISLIQSIARLRIKGDIYIVMSEPNGIIEKSLPHGIEKNNKIAKIFDEYKSFQSTEYSNINSQKIELQNLFSGYINQFSDAIKNISTVDREGMNILNYQKKEQFILNKGENYLKNMFFGGDLSTYMFYISITNQLSNCKLKSIYYNSEINFNTETLSEKIKEHYLEYATSPYNENPDVTNLSVLSGNEIFLYINTYLNKRKIYIDSELVDKNEIQSIKLNYLLNVLTLGGFSFDYSMKNQKDYCKALYFKSCLNETILNDYTGSNEKMVFYFNHYKKWISLIEIINTCIEKKFEKTLLSKKPNQSFNNKFLELDMFNELKKFIEFDDIVKLNIFPFKDTFSKIKEIEKGINNFYKLLVETFFDVNEQDFQSSSEKGIRYYIINKSFSKETFIQKYYTNMLFSNTATVEDFF